MEEIKFDKYYKKLKNKNFTTIRDHYKNIKLGSVVECKVLGNDKQDEIVFHARLNKIKIQTLYLINDEVIAKDLGIQFNPNNCHDYVSISDVMSILNKFYPDLKPEDNVFIYHFTRE